jgi:hypothetical protein
VLTGVTTPSKHDLKHPKNTTRGGRRAGQRWSSRDGTGRVRNRRIGGNIHSDGRSCRVMRLAVGDLMVLQELSAGHPLNQHHNL